MAADFLDQLFDDALKRVGENKPAVDPYGVGSLANDHFLLNKSWKFFKERFKGFEEQFQELMKAKDEQIRVLSEQIQSREKAHQKLEEKQAEQDEFEAEVLEGRLKDYFKLLERKAELAEVGQEERVRLEDKIHQLEFQISGLKKDLLDARQETLRREQAFKDKISELRLKLDAQVVEEADRQKDFQENLRIEQMGVGEREARIDLLRAEVESRDHIIKNLEGDNMDAQKIYQKAESDMVEVKTFLLKREEELENLKIQYQILQEEKKNIIRSWEQEQAQWRELWDRARAQFENQKRVDTP